MRRHFLLVVLLFLVGPTTKSIMAQKSIGEVAMSASKSRKAFLLGNNDYTFGPLKNPERDVGALQKVLEILGFQVYAYKNLTFIAAQQAFQRFIDELSKDKTEVAWVYFSGHGLGVGGVNYLLPTDTHLTCVEQLKTYEAMSLNRWMDLLLSKEIKFNFVFLDACRNLGTLAHCDNSAVTGSIQGLAKPLEKYRGSLIAFATTEGTVADDNNFDKTNSLFTSELLKYLPLPNIGIRKILDLTKEGVYTRSSHTQDPKRWDDLVEDYVFLRTKTEVPPPVAAVKAISVHAYQPNSTADDFELTKMVGEVLKSKFPEYEVNTQSGSKGVSNKGITCIVTRQKSTSKNPVTISNETYDLIKVNTKLKLSFKKGQELIDEIEITGFATDHREEAAEEEAMKQIVEKLKDKSIKLKP
ncbi:MAG: caspase family protein [Spirosomataceae bacterium]